MCAYMPSSTGVQMMEAGGFVLSLSPTLSIGNSTVLLLQTLLLYCFCYYSICHYFLFNQQCWCYRCYWCCCFCHDITPFPLNHTNLTITIATISIIQISVLILLSPVITFYYPPHSIFPYPGEPPSGPPSVSVVTKLDQDSTITNENTSTTTPPLPPTDSFLVHSMGDREVIMLKYTIARQIGICV